MLIQASASHPMRQAGGLGDISLFGDFSLQTLALMGVGLYIGAVLLFGPDAKERRSKLREADAEYRERRRQIKKEYPRLRRR